MKIYLSSAHTVLLLLPVPTCCFSPQVLVLLEATVNYLQTLSLVVKLAQTGLSWSDPSLATRQEKKNYNKELSEKLFFTARIVKLPSNSVCFLTSCPLEKKTKPRTIAEVWHWSQVSSLYPSCPQVLQWRGLLSSAYLLVPVGLVDQVQHRMRGRRPLKGPHLWEWQQLSGMCTGKNHAYKQAQRQPNKDRDGHLSTAAESSSLPLRRLIGL